MKLKMMACYDSKAGAYSAPFFIATVALALRAFAEVTNLAGHQINKNPEDFTLFYLGEWDDETGLAELLADPKPLGKALNYKKGDSDVRQVA